MRRRALAFALAASLLALAASAPAAIGGTKVKVRDSEYEGSGDVFCHDVKLNGGYWWVVGPDGVPRP